MNPEERACYRLKGPDCKHLPGCDKVCGTKFPGVVNCQHYEPVPTLEEALEKIMNDCASVVDFNKRMSFAIRLGLYSSLATLAILILFIVLL